METSRKNLKHNQNTENQRFILSEDGKFHQMNITIPTKDSKEASAETYDLLKNHIFENKPLIVNFKNERGQDVTQEVYINPNAIKTQPSDNFFQVSDFKQLYSESKSVINENKNQNPNGRQSANDQKNQSSDNGQQNSFSDMPNTFGHYQTNNVQSFQARPNGTSYETLYQHVLTKAQEFSKAGGYESKSVFDVFTLNYGKVNVAVEKQGTTLRINLTTDNLENEGDIRENLSELTTNLKLFGFENIEINIDLDSGKQAKEDGQATDGSRQSPKNKKQETTSHEEAAELHHDRNFGYNSFEYIA